jgi:Rrf2 family transcriptional regulator, iron-sulfur cluster assembly transcription factor
MWPEQEQAQGIRRLGSAESAAVGAMIELVLQPERGPGSLQFFMQRLRLSRSRAERVLLRLCREGLVKAVRGPCGGYVLARAAADIRVADIVRAVQPLEEAAPRGTSSRPLPSAEQRSASALWHELEAMLGDWLEAVSLHDLVEQRRQHPPEPGRPCATPEPCALGRPRTPTPVRAPNSIFALAAQHCTN